MIKLHYFAGRGRAETNLPRDQLADVKVVLNVFNIQDRAMKKDVSNNVGFR